MRAYKINLHDAKITNPLEFRDFNDFFTRQLRTDARPIDTTHQGIICPVDGALAAFGTLRGKQLVQAKNMVFSLETLLGSLTDAMPFDNGSYATFYLAPHNYHRVHMPMDAKLIRWRLIPGRLFSVNRMTTDLIPNLYSRNERLICFFESEKGPMVLIFVGALIVGSIQLSFMDKALQGRSIIDQSLDHAMPFLKGQELGLFKLGSTVLTLFPAETMQWRPQCYAGKTMTLGELIGIAIN